MALEKVGYSVVESGTAKQVKIGPSALFGATMTEGTGGTVTVYDDNAGGTSVVLVAKGTMSIGDTIHFGGIGLAASKGLYVVVSGVGVKMNVLYT